MMSYVFIDRRQPKLTVELSPIEDVRQFRTIYKKVYGLHAYPVPVFVATQRRKVDTDDVREYMRNWYNWASVKMKSIWSAKEPRTEPVLVEPRPIENFSIQKKPNTESDGNLNGSNVSSYEGTTVWYSFRALTEECMPNITIMKEKDVYTAIVRLKIHNHSTHRMTVMTYDDLMYMYKHANFFNDVNVTDVVMIPNHSEISSKILAFYGEDSIENDTYFLRFTYDIRKLASTSPRPSHCKSSVVKKIMEYMYNNYEFDADMDAAGIPYGDLYDEIAHHGSYENVADVLGWLGYMIKDGKVKHLRRRAEAKDVAIVQDEVTRKQLQHKIVSMKYNSDFREACEVPFNKKLSAWNMFSL